MWCILCNIECCFLNFLGWLTLITSITFLMNDTLQTMILNCFIKWCSMNRVIFCLIDALKNGRPNKFSSLRYSNLWIFLSFFYLIRRSKEKKISNKKKKTPIRFISQIMLLAYRDNGNIDSSGSTSFGKFSSKNYECVGNETSIHDCPNNEKKCTPVSTTTAKFLPRTELRCKRKTYWIYNNIYNCTFLLLVFNATSNTDQI